MRQVKTKMILVPLVSCVLVWHIETVTGCKGGGGNLSRSDQKMMRQVITKLGGLPLILFVHLSLN